MAYNIDPIGNGFVLDNDNLDFKWLRKRCRKTLREVENQTGISNAYLSQLENGKVKNPSFKVIVNLMQAYGVKVELTLPRTEYCRPCTNLLTTNK